jgi:hypothetical protein
MMSALLVGGALVVLAVAVAAMARYPLEPAHALALTGTPTPPAAAPATRTLRPTDTRWPTLTLTPTASLTPIFSPTPTPDGRWVPGVPAEPVYPSPTPIPMSSAVIGHSVLSREIEVFRFGAGDTARLIIGGIHGGDEGNTVLLAYQLIDYVSAHPEVIPPDKTLYILPDLNPDGYARGRTLDARVNEHGVDLNRNWPWNWKSAWPQPGCWDYRPVTSGPYALSEPETRWLYKFIVERPEIDSLISYHAAALGIFAGGVPDYRPSINLAKTLAGVSDYQYPPIDTGCTMTGDLTDWAATQRIASVDIELHNFRYTDWDENLAILKALLQFDR